MKYLIFLVIVIFSGKVFAWDGYDYDSASDVEIEQGNLVRPGEAIEYYDYGFDEYRFGDVESIYHYGSSVEVKIYDHDSGKYHTFEMER